MALLNGWTGKSGWTGPVNRIDFEPQATFSVQVGFAAPAGIWYTIFNDITQARYCFVGMDKDTAIACAAANHYPASGINARAFLASGHMYSVEVSQYTVVERWEPTTP